MLKYILYNMSLKKKLLIVFGTMIVCTVIGVTVGTTAFSYVQVGGKQYDRIEQKMQIADSVAKLRANLAFVRSSLLSMIIDDNAEHREKMKDSIRELSERIDVLFDELEGQLKGSDRQELLEPMNAAREAWQQFRDTRDRELIPAILAGRTKEAMALARGVQAERYGRFTDESKKVVDAVRGDVPVMVGKMKWASNIVKIMFLGGSVIFISFYVAVWFFLSKNLIAPVLLVAGRSSVMAQGDFSGSYSKPRGQDEIGTMIGSVITMKERVSDTVSHIKSSVMNLSSASEELSATAEGLSSDAQHEAHLSKEVSSSVSQMAQTIGDVAQNASQAAEAAKRSAEVAVDGMQLVERTTDGLTNISNSVREAMQTIEGLSASSAQIGEIVNLIHTIADQTNLLALNAAIEAARAGEQGRGFAVVADEVRKLADKTTNATKDIEQKITMVQSEAEQSLATIRRGNSEAEKGLELARQASSSLDQIVASSNQVQDMVQRIATATEQQSATSEEITRNMQTISEVIERSSDATAQIKTAAHDLAVLALELQDKMTWFKTA